jgi:hypothetical protein
VLYQFVHLSSGDEGEPVTAKSRPKPTALSRKNATATAAKQSQKKVKSDVLGSSKIKHEILVTSSDNEITVERVEPSTTKSDDFLFLPAFARAGWSTRFLTTLNHRQASALNCWDLGDGVDILVVLQGVLAQAFPGTTYVIQYGDKIYSMVRKSIRQLKTVI